jgi:TRAP-type C4-dicarboxylate transport system permease large subunit
VRDRAVDAWEAARRGWKWLQLRGQWAFLIAFGVIVLILLLRSTVTAAATAAAAWVALIRHFAQTEADRQRRLTESYSKAVERLAHADMAVRLGGIYSLDFGSLTVTIDCCCINQAFPCCTHIALQ